MNSQDFLQLILIVSAAFAAWYLHSLWGGKKPTRLNLKADDSTQTLVTQVTSSKRNITEAALNSELPLRTDGPAAQVHPDFRDPQMAKNLNVLFNYNGHAWDAYEVLGVPAGAPLPLVTEAYQKVVKEQQTQSLEFFETAYKAILARK